MSLHMAILSLLLLQANTGAGSAHRLPVPLGHLELPTLPNGAEWMVFVYESGGILGLTESIAVDSTGAVRCTDVAAGCRDTLDPSQIDLLRGEIATAAPDTWVGALGACSDCRTRMVFLIQRSSQEEPREHIAYWNLAVPADASRAERLHRLARVLALR